MSEILAHRETTFQLSTIIGTLPKILVVVILLLAPNIATAQNESADAVKNFRMTSGFAGKVIGPIPSFIGMVEEQKREIKEIMQRSQDDANAIKTQTTIGFEKQLEQLKELSKRQDEELREVLLPHQLERLSNFPAFSSIIEEGFTNSLIEGYLAQSLGLSNDERRDVRDEAGEVLEQYRKDLIDAQKKAIAKLRSSLPAEKRKLLDKRIKPLYFTNDTLWQVSDRMLDPNSKGTFSFKKLPQIVDK